MFKKNLVAIIVGALILLFSFLVHAAAPAQSATLESQRLIEAAQAEIQISSASGNKETACNVYLENVLRRAGFSVNDFVANSLDTSMKQSLPDWRQSFFTTDDAKISVNALKNFLNGSPDNSAFVAQWPRQGQSGHVALIVKEAADQFRIYQAQRGLSLPHSKISKTESLLYAKNQYGDRAHLRLFYK